MHGAVDAAKECEVSGERRDVRIERIIHLYRDHVVGTHVDIWGDIVNKVGEPSLVLSDKMAVHINVGDDVGTVELQKNLAIGEGRVRRAMNTVPANAAVVIVSAILTIEIVPRVGNADRRPGRIVEY